METYYRKYDENGKLKIIFPDNIIRREASRVQKETGNYIADFLFDVAVNAFDYDCVYDGVVDLDAAEQAIINHADDYIDFWRNNYETERI